jgi:3-deoxy-manno-octulosonate cytidylyltransferase (CMP-KDO synthetase)
MREDQREEINMRIVGVIPARFKSTRLNGKPLMDILGKPMIQHVYERARSAECIQDILVATDDARIQQTVERFGGKAVMTSPAHASGTDRVGEVVQNLDVDVVVNIQGDEPLIDPILINECVQALKMDPLVPVATVMRAIQTESDNGEPAVVKVVRDLDGRALYFSRSQIPFPRIRPEGFKLYEHIGLYAYTKDCLLRLTKLPPSPLEIIEGLEQLRALENGIPIRVVETRCTCPYLSVDTPQDLERARRIMATEFGEMRCAK